MYQANGRRKTSTARAILREGNGNFVVNGLDVNEYFEYETLRRLAKSPLELTNTLDKYDITILVNGGGKSGQAGAVRHAISRALLVAEPDLRPVLKQAGYLTRDSRMKERKKYGFKKARKSTQFSKR
ncbi:30S ribosomal protein S9 [uncultured Ezakiella sp.]|mgnify:FL=1|uniref:30S ribosomal protein S9 n=1 Tax=uncultured Ezakiella sp. TaxID=1637529 RepID=UPI0025E1B7AE|nr:30S ribosomal protein S9 [uncultured Ezakiella sp.]